MKLLFIGMMASGKSTIGKRIAIDLGLSFIDQDEYVESFISEPEDRNNFDIWLSGLHKSLEDFKQLDNVLVSSGGEVGTFDNLDSIFDIVVFLDASEELICERIINARKNPSLPENQRRFLVSDKEYFQDIYDTGSVLDTYRKRRPLYLNNCDVLFSYDSCEKQEAIVSDIFDFLNDKSKQSPTPPSLI